MALPQELYGGWLHVLGICVSTQDRTALSFPAFLPCRATRWTSTSPAPLWVARSPPTATATAMISKWASTSSSVRLGFTRGWQGWRRGGNADGRTGQRCRAARGLAAARGGRRQQRGGER